MKTTYKTYVAHHSNIGPGNFQFLRESTPIEIESYNSGLKRWGKDLYTEFMVVKREENNIPILPTPEPNKEFFEYKKITSKDVADIMAEINNHAKYGWTLDFYIEHPNIISAILKRKVTN